MIYLSVKETAIKLGLSERSVRNYCQAGRLKGAKLEGKTWYIPENITKPERKNTKHEINKDVLELLKFLNDSPVNFFAVKNIETILDREGYQKQFEQDANVNLSLGSKVYFVRNGSSLIAVNIGKNINKDNYSYHIIASHSDSPCFKIKPNANSSTDIYNKINVEVYGGMIMSTWLDRPLSIAGRVFIKKGNDILIRLVNINKDCLIIPNLCIHFNRDVNNGYSFNPATDMQPFVGQELEGDVLKNLLKEELGSEVDNIINFDLYLYNRMSATIWGEDNDYISSGRLDDLECVFSSSKAFVESNNDDTINILYISDNEEVGSKTSQGADGDFLSVIINKINNSLGFSIDNMNVALSKSLLISADNAHAVHPNNPGITDSNNCCYMNKGIAIKFNASQTYTSDALSSSIFQEICKRCNVPFQFFTNRSDVRGGSTLGNILLSHLSLKSVDIGLPQLAMHSSYETAGTKDVIYAIDAFKEFYRSNFCFNGDYITIR